MSVLGLTSNAEHLIYLDDDLNRNVEEKIQCAMTENNGELLRQFQHHDISDKCKRFLIPHYLDVTCSKRKSNTYQYKLNAKVLTKIDEA